jgi:Rad3-related DNA helicase
MTMLDCTDLAMLDFFPVELYKARISQINIINQIEWAIKCGKRFIIIQAPTGVGKSAISVTAGRYSKNVYICTPQKSLQDQYTQVFPEIKVVTGRKNHVCPESGYYKDGIFQFSTCDLGPCTGDNPSFCERKPLRTEEGGLSWRGDLPYEQRCPYWQEKMTAIEADITCQNYTYLMLETKGGGGDFRPRDILIADEGHDLESYIINMVKIEVTSYVMHVMAKYDRSFPTNFVTTNPSMSNEMKMRIHTSTLNSIIKYSPGCLAKIRELHLEHYNNLEHVKKMPSDNVEAIEKYLLMVMDDTTKKMILTATGAAAEAVSDSYKDKTEKKRYKKMTINDVGRWVELTNLRISELNADKELIENLTSRINRFLNDVSVNPQWVVMENKKDPQNPKSALKSVTFQPIFVKDYAEDVFFRLGKKAVIIMSATILDPAKLADDLGIDDYYYIHEDPIIPADRNPIFNLGLFDFSSRFKRTPQEEEYLWKEVVNRIDLILETHYNEKGIIHTVTTTIARTIKRLTKYPERILVVDDQAENEDAIRDRQALIDRHCDPNNHEPTIICSPSMTEGLDLRYDLSRLQVWIKIPFPSLGNEWIRARSNKLVDPKFYNNRTARTIIQGIGRSLRDPNDYCITYTFDTRFRYFMSWDEKCLNELFNRHVVPLDKLKAFWTEENYKKLLPKIKISNMKDEKTQKYPIKQSKSYL